MDQTILTFDDVIRAFGGPSKFAEALEIEPYHAQTMKTRGSIPAPYWARVVAAASARELDGITLEKLAKIAQAKAEARQPQSAGAHP